MARVARPPAHHRGRHPAGGVGAPAGCEVGLRGDRCPLGGVALRQPAQGAGAVRGRAVVRDPEPGRPGRASPLPAGVRHGDAGGGHRRRDEESLLSRRLPHRPRDPHRQHPVHCDRGGREAGKCLRYLDGQVPDRPLQDAGPSPGQSLQGDRRDDHPGLVGDAAGGDDGARAAGHADAPQAAPRAVRRLLDADRRCRARLLEEDPGLPRARRALPSRPSGCWWAPSSS